MTRFLIKQQNKKKESILGERRQRGSRIRHLNLNVLLLALIIFVSFSYLYYINQTATGGFDIKGLENQIEVLKKDNKKLEVEAARIQSLSNIEEASQELEMVATTHIEYLPAVGSVVAVR